MGPARSYTITVAPSNNPFQGQGQNSSRSRGSRGRTKKAHQSRKHHSGSAAAAHPDGSDAEADTNGNQSAAVAAGQESSRNGIGRQKLQGGGDQPGRWHGRGEPVGEGTFMDRHTALASWDAAVSESTCEAQQSEDGRLCPEVMDYCPEDEEHRDGTQQNLIV